MTKGPDVPVPHVLGAELWAAWPTGTKGTVVHLTADTLVNEPGDTRGWPVGLTNTVRVLGDVAIGWVDNGSTTLFCIDPRTAHLRAVADRYSNGLGYRYVAGDHGAWRLFEGERVDPVTVPARARASARRSRTRPPVRRCVRCGRRRSGRPR